MPGCTSLLRTQPERIEALELVLLLALLRWRLGERTLRIHVETTETPVRGGDKQATQQPTACMMMTKCAAVLVIKGGLARPLALLATVQQQDLRALGVPATSCPVPQTGYRDATGQSRSPKSPG